MSFSIPSLSTVFGAIALLVTSILAVVLYPEAWEPHSIVMTVCVVIHSVFIVVLEARFLAVDPLSARAHLRNIMTRNFNISLFLWGSGLLYIVAGILNVAQTWLIQDAVENEPKLVIATQKVSSLEKVRIHTDNLFAVKTGLTHHLFCYRIFLLG
jgi:hypothetical protein